MIYTHRAAPSAIFTALTVLVLLTGAAVGFAADEPITFQKGLPSELVIDESRPLDDQLDVLEELVEWAEEDQPTGGGWLDKITGALTGPEGPPSVTVYQVIDDFGTYKGQKVTITGLFTRTGEDTGWVESFGRRLDAELAGGATVEGFDDDMELVGVPVQLTGLAEAAGDKPTPGLHVTEIKPSLWLSTMRMARILEMQGEFEESVEIWAKGAQQGRSAKTSLAGHAVARAAEITYVSLDDKKAANKHYDAAWNHYASLASNGENPYVVWVPRPDEGTWEREPLRQVIGPTMDELNQSSFWYKVVDVFIKIGFGNPGVGVILMAVVVRLMIWPLTRKQLESAKEMQRIQPQIKALQDKYVDDKQKFQEEFWKLCQEHGVNPLGGCLPMLLQLPVLIMLYRGIQAYIWHFNQASFLWIENLAAPDYPLLIAYTISMIFFQKITQKLNPAASMNPEQAQQQQMMTYMMPIVFFFIFQSFPAAFLLYWLGSNLIYFGAQGIYNVREKDSVEDEEAPEPKKKGGAGTFVEGMVSVLQMGGEEDDEGDDGERRSYAEVKAEKEGKKIGKNPDERKRQ